MTSLDPLPPDVEALVAAAREQRAEDEPPKDLYERITARAERQRHGSLPGLGTAEPSPTASGSAAEPVRLRVAKAPRYPSGRRNFWPLAAAAVLGLECLVSRAFFATAVASAAGNPR